MSSSGCLRASRSPLTQPYSRVHRTHLGMTCPGQDCPVAVAVNVRRCLLVGIHVKATKRPIFGCAHDVATCATLTLSPACNRMSDAPMRMAWSTNPSNLYMCGTRLAFAPHFAASRETHCSSSRVADTNTACASPTGRKPSLPERRHQAFEQGALDVHTITSFHIQDRCRAAASYDLPATRPRLHNGRVQAEQ